jgi:hypothetical protein
MSRNWFERHPIKTVSVVVIIALVVMAYGAEKFLAYKNRGVGFNYNLPQRAITLREYRPFMSVWLQAGQEDKHFDTLVAKKYLLRIDGDGFIMPSKRHDRPDRCLVFLGGSTTECRYVEEDRRFPYLAGVFLEEKTGLRINSYNAGRSGNHSLHSLDILLNKVMPLKPDVVVMLHNINDLVMLLYEKSYWSTATSKPVIFDINREITANYFKIIRDRWIPNLAAALHNFDHALRSRRKSGRHSEDEFAKVRGRNLVFDKQKMVEQFAMNLQSFIYLCQARNITPVLMTMSSRFKGQPDPNILETFQSTGSDYGQFKELFDLFNAAIVNKARENNIMVIDLAREIPQENDFMYDIVHYTEKGARRTAEIISDRLAPLMKKAPGQPAAP